ncbi:MAG: ribosome maturation factor RimP [Gemmatimonadota bacterium]
MTSGRLEGEIGAVLAALGFDLVSLERGGGRRRPLLRLRAERPGDPPGRSTLTADDCAAISRAVEERLDAEGELGEDYILEVSSPGVERPLTRPEDYDRFAGLAVRVRGFGPILGSERQADAVLRGTEAGEDGAMVVLLERGSEVHRVPLAAIAKASLAYRPEDDL